MRYLLLALSLGYLNTYAQTNDFDPDLAAQFAQFEGKTAANCILDDPTGKKISLSSFKGKVVYLHFWATWCSVCVGELTELRKMHARLQQENPDIVFVNIAIDSEKDDWLKLLTEYQVPGINLFDIANENNPKRSDKMFGLEVLPSYVIIGKDGNILGYDTPSPDEDIMADWALLQAAKGISTYKAYEAYAKNTPEFVAWMKAYLKKYPD